jgi:hypothetical protein
MNAMEGNRQIGERLQRKKPQDPVGVRSLAFEAREHQQNFGPNWECRKEH